MKAKVTIVSAFLCVVTSLVFSGGTVASASTSSVYKISTANCPATATQKITGTLTIGVSGPLSGPIAPFVDAYVQGIKDRYAYQNANGGIGGVQLAVTAEDDQFNPATTKSNFDGWIQSGAVQSRNPLRVRTTGCRRGGPEPGVLAVVDGVVVGRPVPRHQAVPVDDAVPPLELRRGERGSEADPGHVPQEQGHHRRCR